MIPADLLSIILIKRRSVLKLYARIKIWVTDTTDVIALQPPALLI